MVAHGSKYTLVQSTSSSPSILSNDFALLEVSLIVSIAFGMNNGSYTKAYIVYLVLNISSKSVRVGAKDIFTISWNTFDKTKPVKYM